MPKLSETKYYTWTAGTPGGTGTMTLGARLPLKYDGFAVDIGMTAHPNEGDAIGLKVTTNQAVKMGYLMKMRINYRTTSGNRAADIYVPPDKVQDAIQKLNGKEYGAGNTITRCASRMRLDY